MNTFTNNSSRKDVIDLDTTNPPRELTPTQQFCHLVKGYAQRNTSYRAALHHAFGHPLRMQYTDAWMAFYRAFDQADLPECAEEDAYFIAGLICSQGDDVGVFFIEAINQLPEDDMASALHRLRELLPVHNRTVLHKKLFGLIRYLQSKREVTIKPSYLFDDLLHWNQPSHDVQRKWLRHLKATI